MDLRRKIGQIYLEVGNWSLTGLALGVSGGLAYRIYSEDYEPKTAHLRFILGLPTLIPVAPCPTCGDVHLAKGCPKQPKRPHVYHYVTIDGRQYRVTLAVKNYIEKLQGGMTK